MNKYTNITIAFITASLMSMAMSFVMTLVNVGIGPIFLIAWLKGWLIGLAVSFPLSYFIPPATADFINKRSMKNNR